MSSYLVAEPRGQYSSSGAPKPPKPHDEAFKKLLQTFFLDFLQLFFPDLYRMINPAHTRLLMQELLVDLIGEEKRVLDLLIETRLAESDAYLLLLIETQSYKDPEFSARMFIYFSRLFERHRREHRWIVPIAIFAYDDVTDAESAFTMSLPGIPILNFQYLKVELRKCNWRDFVDSGNPVAAALLSKMGYTRNERRQARMAFLRMILRLTSNLDAARLALIMSFADLYFEPVQEEDEAIMKELRKDYPAESEQLLELMPAWKRWGYEEGIEKGIEKGIEQGKLQGKLQIATVMLDKGFTPEQVANMTDLPLEQIRLLPRTPK